MSRDLPRGMATVKRRGSGGRTGPVPVNAAAGPKRELKVSARKSRASSCPGRARPRRCEAACGAREAATCRSRERRAGSGCAETRNRTHRDHRSALTRNTVEPKCRETRGGPAEPRSVRTESLSHKAFTVIAPNPKKRQEIQRQAEAELAALEELRLSRAMAYVSINPSTVGGCLSLEEVRVKQQQMMMESRMKQKPIKKQLMQQTPILTS